MKLLREYIRGLLEQTAAEPVLDDLSVTVRVSIDSPDKPTMEHILTKIRGLPDVITVRQDASLRPAPEGKQMADLVVRFERGDGYTIDDLIADLTGISGVDMAKLKTINDTPHAKESVRQVVRGILTEGIEFREVDSPLQYHSSGNVKRLALCDSSVTDPPRPHDHYFAEIERWRKRTKGGRRKLKKPVLDEIIPGVSDVCIIGFLDYHQRGPDYWYIDYMKTRGDKGGQKVATRLVDKFFSMYAKPASIIDFGKMMTPAIGHLKEKMEKQYPDVNVMGAKYY